MENSCHKKGLRSGRKKQKVCDKESECNVDSYKESAKSRSEHLVLNEFPLRLLELQNLLQSEKFSIRKHSLFESDINIPIPPKQSVAEESGGQDSDCLSSDPKVFLFENGSVEANKYLVELIEILKPKALQLIRDSNSVKMGISLMIPKIEDGNNFGVQIQQEMLVGVAVVEVRTQQQLEQISSYFAKRAELVTKIAKYPHCQDYRRAVLEIDDKFRLFLCLLAVDLRNHYISLHDMFTKNLNKIKEPRSSDNHSLMY